MEEKCLKASGHFAPAGAVYETPSDYDPLSINLGQLAVYRVQLRCRCANLGWGEQCSQVNTC